LTNKPSTTRSKILLSAELLFATKRFHEVRMEDLAVRAGVGKGTIYRYFKDKKELYVALLKEASTDLILLIEKAIEQQKSCVNKLIHLVKASITLFDAKPHLFDLILQAEALQRNEGEFPWQQTRSNVIQIVESIFKLAEGRKEFTIEDPKNAALQLLGGLRAVIRFGKKPRHEHLSFNMVQHFLNGFSTPA